MPNGHIVFAHVKRVTDRAAPTGNTAIGWRIRDVAGVPDRDELHARLAVGHVKHARHSLGNGGRRQHARQHDENHCTTMRHDVALFPNRTTQCDRSRRGVRRNAKSNERTAIVDSPFENSNPPTPEETKRMTVYGLTRASTRASSRHRAEVQAK